MELIFLGTSSALPTPNRNHSSIALKAFGEIMLFDCGEGTQRQMARIKLSPMKVNNIFITHLHGDHFLGLPGMIQSMAFRGRKEPLHIYGPKGINETVHNIKNLGFYSLSFQINAHEVEEGVVAETDEYLIKCCPTHHSIVNLAYSVEEKRSPKFLKEKAIKLGLEPGPDFGKLQRGISVEVDGRLIEPEEVLGPERRGRKIVYSGDTRPCLEMVDFAKHANVLIHESTFESSQEVKARETGHSTTTQAAEIAKKAEVSLLILSHISTRYRDSNLLKEEANQIFDQVMVAEDFKVIEVERNGG
ncbi:MAG: ribonuclease Z [Methanobacteriaceae archaeon]|nr:ribonuclease Z [Methanobacteriaceae archaeon]